MLIIFFFLLLFILHVTRRKAKSLLPLAAHSVYIIQIRSMASIFPSDFIPQYTPFAISVFLCSQALEKFYHGSTLSRSRLPFPSFLLSSKKKAISEMALLCWSLPSLEWMHALPSIPYMAAGLTRFYWRFFSMSILPGAKHAVSVLSV